MEQVQIRHLLFTVEPAITNAPIIQETTKSKTSHKNVPQGATLPDLLPVDELLDYVSDHTLSWSLVFRLILRFVIPKNKTNSFIMRPIIPSDRDKMHSGRISF
jgi:hypothetical protein